MDELFLKMAIRLSESIEQMVSARLQRFMEKFCRSEIKIGFSEAEAAKQLNVSITTLAAWRKAGHISYCQYPQIKRDELGDIYTYDIADLLNFRAKFKVNAVGNNVYEIDRRVSLAGAEIKRVA